MLSGGWVFAGYQIERVPGAGGMGTVYLARNPDLPRSEALKVLNAGAGSAQVVGDHIDKRASLPVPVDRGAHDHLRQHHTPQRRPNYLGYTIIRWIVGYQSAELSDSRIHFQQVTP
jgi:serine/threonine protein kinase